MFAAVYGFRALVDVVVEAQASTALESVGHRQK